MYGWRSRIGLIIPSSNTTMEEEFRRILPEGVSLHISRIQLREVTKEELIKMEKGLERAAEELKDTDADIIVFGCTTGSLIGGYGYDEKISKEIEKISGKKALTTSTAVLKALNTFQAKRIVIATPYIKEVNMEEKKFLEDNGFTVIDIKGLGLKNNLDIGKQSPHITYRLVKSLNIANADCIFISCTNFRTLEIINPLEEDLNIPIITSNQATFWYTFKKLGIPCKNELFGKLFSK